MFLRASVRAPGLRKIPLALAMSLLLPALLGCPDLKPVEQLATDADEAKPALVPIAADFKGSCDRENAFVEYRTDTDNPVLPCSNGADLAKLGQNILKEQSLLLDYFHALGSLADADASG